MDLLYLHQHVSTFVYFSDENDDRLISEPYMLRNMLQNIDGSVHTYPN